MADHVRRGGEPWWRWLSGLAVVGYAVIAVTNVVGRLSMGRTAQAFAGLDADGQAALERAGPATLDPTLAWRFRTLGPWMAIVSGVAWRRGFSRRSRCPSAPLAGPWPWCSARHRRCGRCIVLTSLYNASRGSILVVALLHGSWNWVATSDAFAGIWVAIMTTVIMVAAPLIILAWGATHLAPSDRPVLPASRN